MPNSTVTITQTQATSTVTLTGSTHTTTIQAKAVTVFGLPWEFAAVLVVVMGALIFFIAQQNGRASGIKAELLWVYRNLQALQLNVQRDLAGIFLPVKAARGGKIIERLRRTGIPLDVMDVRKAKAYLITFTDKDRKKWRQNHKDEIVKWLAANPGKKESEFDAYPAELQRDARPECYLDISRGQFKRTALFMGIEGIGETVDFKAIVEGSILNAPQGSSGIIHELVNAAKEFFRLKAEMMKGSLQTFLLPMVLGLFMGMVALMLVVILTGGKL